MKEALRRSTENGGVQQQNVKMGMVGPPLPFPCRRRQPSPPTSSTAAPENALFGDRAEEQQNRRALLFYLVFRAHFVRFCATGCWF